MALAVVTVLGAAAVAQGPGMRGTRVAPGEACPAGTTEVRPGSCQAPESPAPSIVDYRPRVHAGDAGAPGAEGEVSRRSTFTATRRPHHRGIDRGVVAEMDKLNLRVLVSADNSSGDRLTRTLQAINASPHKDRFRVLAGIDFRNVGPGWGAKGRRAARGRRQGRRGRRRRSRRRLRPDASGSRTARGSKSTIPSSIRSGRRSRASSVPAFIHTAEPQEFFQPLDMHNERWLELSLFADRRNNQPGKVTFEELMTERNNVFRKHPKTRFIAAHFGWHANDLARAGKMLDDFPNVTVEVGAILYDLGRQPRAAHDFFVKYQDRILFGKDAFEPDEYPVLLARVRNRATSTSTTTATITRSGSCTGWTCRTTC